MRELKFAILLALTALSFSAKAAGVCTGQSIDCFDAQTQKWKTFPSSDTCEDYYDDGWKTRAYCGKEGSSPSKCIGRSIDCFDAETQKWINFSDANACEDYYDGGWKTRAYCK